MAGAAAAEEEEEEEEGISLVDLGMTLTSCWSHRIST